MRRLATALSALAFLWACGATTYLLSGEGHGAIRTRFALSRGAGEAGSPGVPLMSSDGVWIVTLLVVVTVLAGVPLGAVLSQARGHRIAAWVAGLLLLGFSAMSALTLGLFYLPCAIVLIGAAVASGTAGLEVSSRTSAVW